MLQKIFMTLLTTLTIAARNPISGVSLTINENSLLAPSILAIPLKVKNVLIIVYLRVQS